MQLSGGKARVSVGYGRCMYSWLVAMVQVLRYVVLSWCAGSRNAVSREGEGWQIGGHGKTKEVSIV